MAKIKPVKGNSKPGDEGLKYSSMEKVAGGTSYEPKPGLHPEYEVKGSSSLPPVKK